MRGSGTIRMQSTEAGVSDRLMKERRARLAAERQMDELRRELHVANQKLAMHAQTLSDQIAEQKQGLQQALTEAASLKGENTRYRSDLERALTQGRNAQRRLWDALETIRDGFAIYDHGLNLVTANRAYHDLFRARGALVSGISYAAVMRILATEGMIDMEGRDANAWQGGMLARIHRDSLTPVVLRTMSGRHVKLTDRWGAEGDLVCLVQDITETVTREEELEEARRRAEAASRAKTAFLANMSHEIRTPMNGIVGMAELLSETELTGDQKLYSDTIRTSGEALLSIINEILEYSKIEADRMKLYPEPFDLERCLHEVMALLLPAARDKGLRLIVDYDLFLPTRFIADPGRIRQIFTNLIGNAVKFTPEGYVLARVVGFEQTERNYQLHFSVEDTGIGIGPNDLEHIFGEFNQVESAANRRFEGTGLGLSITRHLVQMMGGEIWVKSELGQGSCFGFELDLVADEVVESPAQKSEPITLRAALVIDDMLVNRMVLERQLEAYGLTVTAVRSAAEAYRLIDGGANFDVILADSNVADMNPAELAAKLRGQGGETPVVMMTADPAACARSRAADTMINCMEKPILRSDLYRMLQKLSRQRKPKEVAAPVATPAPAPVAQNATLRQMRVLTAEDNRTNQLVFAKMVKDIDVDLRFVDNGREAVEMWRSFKPDLIFMDISMPEMDGKAAIRAIRAEEEGTGNRVPICALTAYAMEGENISILQAGADHYLTKPLKRAAISARIAAHQPSECRTPV